MTNDEIIIALKPAFPDVYPMQTGGGVVCPSIPVGPNGAYALITDEGDGLMVGFYDADVEDDEGTIVLTQGTIEQAIVMLFALRARFEILADFEPEEVADVNDFIGLQDICDANEYLEPAFKFCSGRDGRPLTTEALPFLNAVIDAIEALGTFKGSN